MRHTFAFLASLALHAVVLTCVIWLIGVQQPQRQEKPSGNVVSFNFGELIATRQITQKPTSPEPKITEPDKPESIIPETVKAEPKSNVVKDIVPLPVVKPVVEKKVVKPKQEVVAKKKPKKKVIKKPKKKKKHKKKTVKKKRKESKKSKKVTQKKTQKKTNRNNLTGRATALPSANHAPVVTQSAKKTTSSNAQLKAQQGIGSHKSTRRNGNKKSSNAYKNGLVRAISRVAQRNYPKKAKRMRKQGTVRVSFQINSNGVISNIRVVGSSGNSSLDKAAAKALKRLGRYKKPPAGFPSTVTVPIRFSLR